MSFKMTVVKRVPNPHYDAEKARVSQERRYSPYNQIEPYDVPAIIDERVLEIELLDEEFDVVRRDVLEQFS